MRCTECGYQNDDGVEECIKCGTKMSEAPSEIHAVLESPPETGADGANPTVKGRVSNQTAWDVSMEKQAEEADYFRCSECGHYPLEHPVSAKHPCPNCNFTESDKASNKTKKMENVDFGAQNHSVRLTEIRTKESHEFHGKQVILNRSNLDPSNDSISSKHATLNFKNGSWFINDISSNHATFIQVQDETRLPKGCRIIIGNKIYRVDY